jgi:hypothetical protein
LTVLAAIVKRVYRIERQIENAGREMRAQDCICFQSVVAVWGKLAEFEAEMNKTCPVHGFRRLKHPIVIVDDGPNDPDLPRINELIDRYERRYEEYERTMQRRKDVIKRGVLKSASNKRQVVL